MNKGGICAGHYDGANTIPAKYRKPEYGNYSEGTVMHTLVNRVCAKHPGWYNARPEAGTANPFSPDWMTRAIRLKNAGCDLAIECHTNWSINGSGQPNHGIFLVIVSLCYEAGIHQAEACQEEIQLATKMWKPLADKLGLKFEIRTRKGGGNWDYYSFINDCKRKGIAHPQIIEHGYHVDFAPKASEWIEIISDYYADIEKTTGVKIDHSHDIVTPPPTIPPTTEYVDFKLVPECYTLYSVSKKFNVPVEYIRLSNGDVPDSGSLRLGMYLRVWFHKPPIYFVTTKTCYTLWAVHSKFGVPLTSIHLADGSEPNALAMRENIRLRIG